MTDIITNEAGGKQIKAYEHDEPCEMREFDSGATRNDDPDRLDYEGFLCPMVLERYAQYMHKNRIQGDGKLRDSDNWQKGMPREQYLKSMWRHFHEVWRKVRCGDEYATDDQNEDLCALMFNVMGYLHENLKGMK